MVESIEILTYWHFCFTNLLNGDFAEGGSFKVSSNIQ